MDLSCGCSKPLSSELQTAASACPENTFYLRYGVLCRNRSPILVYASRLKYLSSFYLLQLSFFFLFSVPTYLCPLSPSAGRKREWFTVDDAIKVLQSHKPVHAEYLRRLQLSCSPTNGNSILPSPPPNDNYPHYSTTTGAPSTGSVLGSSCR